MADLSQEGTDGLEQESDDVYQLLQTAALVLISLCLVKSRMIVSISEP